MAQYKPGQIVRVAEWVGVVLDVLPSASGHTFLRVHSARNIFRRMGAEFIEADLNPDAIKPATERDLRAEIDRYRQLFEAEAEKLVSLASKA